MTGYARQTKTEIEKERMTGYGRQTKTEIEKERMTGYGRQTKKESATGKGWDEVRVGGGGGGGEWLREIHLWAARPYLVSRTQYREVPGTGNVFVNIMYIAHRLLWLVETSSSSSRQCRCCRRSICQ